MNWCEEIYVSACTMMIAGSRFSVEIEIPFTDRSLKLGENIISVIFQDIAGVSVCLTIPGNSYTSVRNVVWCYSSVVCVAIYMEHTVCG